MSDSEAPTYDEVVAALDWCWRVLDDPMASNEDVDSAAENAAEILQRVK